MAKETEHLRIARYWASRAKVKGAELFITTRHSKLGGKNVRVWCLEERYYPCVEVEWTTRHFFETREEAEEVFEAGICADWLGAMEYDD